MSPFSTSLEQYSINELKKNGNRPIILKNNANNIQLYKTINDDDKKFVIYTHRINIEPTMYSTTDIGTFVVSGVRFYEKQVQPKEWFVTEFDIFESNKTSHIESVDNTIIQFNRLLRTINVNSSYTYLTLYVRPPDTYESIIIRKAEEERRKAETQRVMDIDTINKKYGMSLIEVKLTTYTQLGIAFSVFRVELSTESDNTTRDHYFVCITYNPAVTDDERVALTKYGIVEYSILKYFKVNNGANIYLNDSDIGTCFSNVTEFNKDLKALPEQESKQDSNNSITLFLITPSIEGLIELKRMKDEAQGTIEESEPIGQPETREESEPIEESKPIGQPETTKISSEALVSTREGGRVRVRSFINSLTKRRKSINRRKIKNRTLKKYNKAQIRRFNNKTKLNRTMKGGGGMFNLLNRKPAEYYTNWIIECEQIIKDLESDTSYGLSYPGRPTHLKELRLEIVREALQNFKEKKKVNDYTIKKVLEPLIRYYDKKEITSGTSGERLSQQTEAGDVIYNPVENQADKVHFEPDVEIQQHKEPPKLDVESDVINQEDEVQSNPDVESDVINQEDESIFKKMADYFKQSNTNRPRIGARKPGVEVPNFDWSKKKVSGLTINPKIVRNNMEAVMAEYTTNPAFRRENMGGKSKRIFKRNVKNKKKSKKKLN
jgi:hypothetical protein